MARRRIPKADGASAVEQVQQGEASRSVRATAVRYLLEELAERAPGNAVEVRVPPFGATQCVAGPKHSRGTPPNVIEMDADTWVALATGRMSWSEGLASSRVSASGTRAHLHGIIPFDEAAATPAREPDRTAG